MLLVNYLTVVCLIQLNTVLKLSLASYCHCDNLLGAIYEIIDSTNGQQGKHA